MTGSSKAGAVLYAKDLERVASFYAAALSLNVAGRDEEHVHLKTGAVDLVVRQIPADLASKIPVATPPSRRDDAAIKLVFFVSDLPRLHSAVTTHGGVMDRSAKPWVFDGCQVWDALDPEGNVVQFRIPSVEPTS
jgi:predicted enzyme related to lactoylglutathione lyase